MTKKIFISYRRADTAWAAVCLREGLTRRLDVDVFLDFKTLFPGVEFAEAINGSIDACDVLIAIIGPKWFTTSNDDGTRRIDNPKDWVRMEISRALEQGKTVIPVTCDDAVMPDESWFPEPLRPLAGRQALELESKDYDPVIEGFATSLRTNYGFEPSSAEHLRRAPHPVPEAEAEEDRDPRTLFFMGLETFQTGNYRKAEQEFAEVASRSLMANGYDDLLTLRAQRWMSNAIVRQGRVAEAASILSIISLIQREAQGEEHSDYLSTKYELASALLDQGKAAEAEVALRDLLPVEERVSDAEHPDTLSTRYEIARALLAQGKAAEAEAMLRDLLPVEERVKGADHPHTLTTRSNIAQALLDQGAAAEAEAAWRDLWVVWERVSGADHPHTLVTRCRLAKAVFAQGREAEAADDLEALAPLALRVLAETDSHLGYIAFLRAQCADALGDPSAADAFLAEAEANWGDRLTPEHPFRKELTAYLADRNTPAAS